MLPTCICKTWFYAAEDRWIYHHHEHIKMLNIQFIIIDKHLVIVDTKGFKENCALCNCVLTPIIYGGRWPNVKASFDGDINMPLRIYDYDVMLFTKSTWVYNEPRLGPFIYGYTTSTAKNSKFNFYNSIIYSISGEIKQLEETNYLTVDGKMAVCCHTANNNYIIIDEDGKIIDSQVSCSESNIYKVGNGHLLYEYIKSLGNVWTFITEPALKTKPAAAAE
jgi:hypothetical protein